MKRMLWLFVLIVSLLGCSTAVPPKEPETVLGIPGSHHPIAPQATIHCDTAFTAMERKELEYAADLWKRQTSGLAVITLVYDVNFESTLSLKEHVDAKHHIMLRLEGWMELVRSMDSGDSLLLGVVSPSGGIHNPWHKPLRIGFVVDRLGGEVASLTQVALHEFGHVLGMPHLNAIYAVMYPSAIKSASVCLKKPDLSAFCQVNECGSYRMHPCE